jgi:large subunit ribosomal protein L31e
MAEKSGEKNEKEKVFIIPIWKKVIKTPKYKRAKKAISIIKEFAARHMKTDEVKIGRHLNLRIWENGIKSPPHKVKVRITKKDAVATVELFDAPAEKKQEKKKEKKEAKEEKDRQPGKQEKKEEKKEQPKAEEKEEKAKPEKKKEDKKPEPKAEEKKPAEKEAAKEEKAAKKEAKPEKKGNEKKPKK